MHELSSIFLPRTAASRVHYLTEECHDKSNDHKRHSAFNYRIIHKEKGRERCEENTTSEATKRSHFRQSFARFLGSRPQTSPITPAKSNPRHEDGDQKICRQ